MFLSRIDRQRHQLRTRRLVIPGIRSLPGPQRDTSERGRMAQRNWSDCQHERRKAPHHQPTVEQPRLQNACDEASQLPVRKRDEGDAFAGDETVKDTKKARPKKRQEKGRKGSAVDRHDASKVFSRHRAHLDHEPTSASMALANCAYSTRASNRIASSRASVAIGP